MVSGSIILVDDDAQFRKMYSEFLSIHGYTVITVESGAEAIKMLTNCTPTALLLDVSMPVMDGIETCKEIRRTHGGKTPIIFLTSFNEVEKIRECMLAGGDDFMIKSDKLDAVLERVAFWSTGSNRHAARERRERIVKSVEEY